MLNQHTLIKRRSHAATTVAHHSLWLLWQATRLPLLALLQAIAPAVRPALRTLGLLGVLMSFFFKFLRLPHFPFLGMLAISVSFMLALMAYDAAVRVLSIQHLLLIRDR
jgi:hypothetical protein